MEIVGIAAKQAQFDFAATVYAYALMAITQFDALFTAGMKISAIMQDPETVINKYFDPNGLPTCRRLRSPEYTPGHSTISSANAEALTHVSGDNFAYTDTSELEFGIKSRSFKSFRDAAEKTTKFAFFGGLHFHHSCIISTEYGRKVGDFIVDRLKMKKKLNPDASSITVYEKICVIMI